VFNDSYRDKVVGVFIAFFVRHTLASVLLALALNTVSVLLLSMILVIEALPI
jgi:hypothetical protein